MASKLSFSEMAHDYFVARDGMISYEIERMSRNVVYGRVYDGSKGESVQSFRTSSIKDASDRLNRFHSESLA